MFAMGMGSHFLHAVFEKVPNHEKIEANEEAQNTPTVCHQGAQGVGKLLCLCDYARSIEHDSYLGSIRPLRIERLIRKLKSVK